VDIFVFYFLNLPILWKNFNKLLFLFYHQLKKVKSLQKWMIGGFFLVSCGKHFLCRNKKF